MRRPRKQPPPKTLEILKRIRELAKRGQTPTVGILVKDIGKSRGAVTSAVERLVKLKWIRRKPLQPGCPRELIPIR